MGGKGVLDLACGEGYGSRILSETAANVLGVDGDRNSIVHAAKKYIKANLEFCVGSVCDVPVEGEAVFDVITCFEALEHVEQHDMVMAQVRRLLKPGGLFIASTPNKLVYTDELGLSNPFHVKELYLHELETLLKRYFQIHEYFGAKGLRRLKLVGYFR